MTCASGWRQPSQTPAFTLPAFRSRLHPMQPSPTSRITAVSPLWAVEGGRVTISGSGFAVEPQPPEVRLGERARNGFSRVAAIADGHRSLRPRRRPYDGSRGRRAWRDGLRRDWSANCDRRAPGRQPRLRSRGQPLRDLQRIAGTGDTRVDLTWSAGMVPANRSSSGCTTRRRWPLIRRDGCTFRPASMAAFIVWQAMVR